MIVGVSTKKRHPEGSEIEAAVGKSGWYFGDMGRWGHGVWEQVNSSIEQSDN
jgi:hypothetical protein